MEYCLGSASDIIEGWLEFYIHVMLIEKILLFLKADFNLFNVRKIKKKKSFKFLGAVICSVFISPI